MATAPTRSQISNFCRAVTLRIVATAMPLATFGGIKIRKAPVLLLPQLDRNHTKVLARDSFFDRGIWPRSQNALHLKCRPNLHKISQLRNGIRRPQDCSMEEFCRHCAAFRFVSRER